MKRSLALVCAAVALWGCRSSNQATNPFMRSTVPPPGTGQAMPGYPAGVQPPQVLPGTPATTPAPVAPPTNQFAPPGGSFNYQQSSIDRTKAVAPHANERRVSATALARRSTAKPRSQTTPAAAVEATQLADSTQTQPSAVGFARAESSLPEAAMPADAHQVIETGYNTSTIRIVNSDPTNGSADDDVQKARIVTSQPIRLTVKEAVPEITDLAAGESNTIRKASYAAPAASDYPSGGTSQLKSLPSAALAEPAQFVPVNANPIPNVTAGSDSQSLPRYGHAADYSTLRGKLEYSASSKQWKLRYIPIDGDTDNYGGSVVLSSSTGLDGFKAGEFVAVQGAISAKAGGSSHGFSANYDLARIERVQ